MALPQRTLTASPLSAGGVADGHGGVADLHHDGFRLPARGASVAVARHRVRSRLPLWGFGGEVCRTAELVISELFTNALVHSRSEHILCLLRADPERSVHVEVADQGGGPAGPTLREAGTEDEGGRGLALVSALADSWGDHPGPSGGRVVWARLNTPSNAMP